MANFFVDSSALAKRYTNEIGTVWVRSWTKSSAGNLISIGELALVEIFSVFARREYNGDLTPNSADRFRRIFSAHVSDEYSVVGINGALIASAQTLVSHHVALGLRTLDAIQLACALSAQTALRQPITFVSADVKLLNAAIAEGFMTDDPNHHP